MTSPRRFAEHAGLIYRTCQKLTLFLWNRIGSLDVRGLERIPKAGPFLLISNHQSILDPMLIQSVIQRPIYAMAKSTQFAAPLVGRLMPYLNSFPVRRYQVDPQATRTALRLLDCGCAVAIYIEGERSWNGILQEPRQGTVRLALRAGVPIIPAVISGSYHAWPRWASRPATAAIRIRILPPLSLPHLRGEANRAALAAGAHQIMQALACGLAEIRPEGD